MIATKLRSKTSDILVKAGLLILLSLVPVMFSLQTEDAFQIPKETLSYLLILFILSIWFVKMFGRGELKLVRTPLDVPLLIFSLIAILSLLNSVSVWVGLKDLSRVLSYFLLYLIVVNLVESRRQVNGLLMAVMISAGLAAAYGILQYHGLDPFRWGPQPGGYRQVIRSSTFGNPNYLAGYLILVLPISLVSFYRARGGKKALILLIVSLIYACLLVTFTKGAWVGLVAGLIFMAVYLLRLKDRERPLRIDGQSLLLIIILGVISLYYLTPNRLNPLQARVSEKALSSRGWESSLNTRRLKWLGTMEMIKDHPLMGLGIGSFQMRYVDYQADFLADLKHSAYLPFARRVTKAHNEYLQLWAELGIFGLGTFLWLLIGFYRCGFRTVGSIRDKGEQILIVSFMAATIGVLVHSLVSFPFHLIANGQLFFFLVGLVVKGREIYGESNLPVATTAVKGRAVRITAQVAMVAVAVILSIMVIRPFLASVWSKKALGYAKRGRLEEAVRSLERALIITPHAERAHFFLGAAYLEMREYDRSIEASQAALRYANAREIYLNLGAAYRGAGRLEEAAAAYRKAVAINPVRTDGQKLLNEVLWERATRGKK